ncbi:MAG: hypothetical protein ABI618_07670 [Nitrospirota bacterium]
MIILRRVPFKHTFFKEMRVSSSSQTAKGLTHGDGLIQGTHDDPVFYKDKSTLIAGEPMKEIHRPNACCMILSRIECAETT